MWAGPQGFKFRMGLKVSNAVWTSRFPSWPGPPGLKFGLDGGGGGGEQGMVQIIRPG